MKFNKIIIMFFLVLFIISDCYAISNLQAKNITKKYLYSNEFLDNTSELINCEGETYFISPILDSSANLQLFVPIDNKTGLVYSEDDTTLSSLFKSSYLLKEINKASNNNYLSLQLIDKVNQLVTILDSKSSQLQGIISSNYSTSITNAVKLNKNDLDTLNDILKDIKSNLDSSYRLREDFINNTNCKDSDELIVSLKNAFSGYDQLTAKGLAYQNSANIVIEKVVSQEDLAENNRRLILNYAAIPVNLSSDISTIYDSLSKTNSFYNPIINELLKSGESSPVNVLKSNLISRKDYVKAKSLLYDYDEDLEATLDSSIQYVLDSSVVEYWKNTETVTKLRKNYTEINKLYEDSKYDEAINKIEFAKTQVKNIRKEGFIEVEDAIDNTNYYIALVIAAILIIFLLFLRYKKKNKSKFGTSKIKYKSNKDKEDPFT